MGVRRDTIPNLYVIAKKGSEKVEYTPVQSGMDGRLENGEKLVYDFTPYDKMAEFSGSDEIPDAEFCGNWIAFANDGNGEERALVLELTHIDGDEILYGTKGKKFEFYENES